jgi:hypothetical protein
VTTLVKHLFGIFLLFETMSFIVDIPTWIWYIFVIAYFYKRRGSISIFERRFSKLKASAVVDEEAKDIFSMIMDLSQVQNWDLMISDYCVEGIENDHTDIISL